VPLVVVIAYSSITIGIRYASAPELFTIVRPGPATRVESDSVARTDRADSRTCSSNETVVIPQSANVLPCRATDHVRCRGRHAVPTSGVCEHRRPGSCPSTCKPAEERTVQTSHVPKGQQAR
jgi:hypothetical protein